jgi:pimeloyl-ACP methyl ester carboxylesterase
MMKEGILDLADGRKLAYAEWGPPDAPAGFYCHGFPTNRRELLLIQPALERHGVEIRLIVLNRPGYGPSTSQAHRTFLDWPDDIAETADLLGIEEFAVLGVSGGCPYALACGYALDDRVTRVGIVVGMAPLEATAMEDASAISGPSAHRLVRRFQFAMMAYGFRKGGEDRFLAQSLTTMGDADREAMERPEMQEWFFEMTREALQQGGGPAAYEAGLYRQPWGFDVQRVTAKTHLWYGGADKTVPAAAGRWLADRLPNSDYVLWPKHGHFTWMLGYEAAEVIATTAGAQ